ncbi:MAG: radical SAM protein, partial [Candidatus Gottesmanbacteria bacterium]
MNEIIHEISAKVAFSPTCNLRCVYCRGSRSDTTLPASMEDFRRQPLETGSISTEVLLSVLQHLHEEGLRQIRPTGGEPLLRNDWDVVVNEAARMGYSDVDITTNGILLENYLDRHGSLPEGLSMVKISLDTHDPNKFKEITGGGELKRVIEGIKAINGRVYTRANRVLLRSDMNERELVEFITFCQKIGLNGVQYLDLVHYSNMPSANASFFENEFVAFPEFKSLAEKVLGIEFT